ncbi:cyclic nucleotide-binding domain-containing protein [Flagellimonas olearia]|uniref:Cyclic nucleotide-binding domain-containing protein n=1 Tax=Flagellimonas olearia TaxID=552546 RepID=A0A6I1DW09_9FLAO|nr:Crp/Fnr family transcriptional regulator [Allomuricauda olearia]KAB7528164.1 cyclic nucleotide-binding domain-containing protein [Allomuricauda olearia]
MFQQIKEYLLNKSMLTDAEIGHIIGHFSVKKVNKNTLLLDANETCRHFYFINKGAVRIYSLTHEGVELSRFFAFEDTFCTALPSFIDQQPSYEYFQAIEKTELLQISRSDFYKLVGEFNGFEKIYREILELSFINNQKRIYSYQGYSALERIKLLMKMQPNFLFRVSNKLAASYLGISPYTLSRLKSKL